MPPAAATTDPTLEKMVWILFASVVGLVLREIWQALRDRKARRDRDRLILSALLREIHVIRGAASAIVQDINRERILLTEGRWRLKPLMVLPAGVYDLVKPHAPKALLQEANSLVDLVRLQAQCTYTNQVADEQRKWKSPTARDQPDQLDTIISFHPAIEESVVAVVERCDKLIPALQAAGKKVGGLNLQGAAANRAD